MYAPETPPLRSLHYRILRNSLILSLALLIIAHARAQSWTQGNVVPLGSTSVGRVIVVDLDGDTKGDVLVVNGSSLQFFKGDGTGALAEPRQLETNVFDVTTGAFITPKSGRNDLIFLGYSDVGLGLYLIQNLGRGNVATATSIPSQGIPGLDSSCHLATVDINGDGYPDVALACGSLKGQVYVGLNDGAGHFTFQAFAVGSQANMTQSITTGDFNGDGVADVVVSSIDTGGSLRTSMLAGNAAGAPSDIPSPLAPAQVLLAGDFNGDTLEDTLSSNGTSVAISYGATQGNSRIPSNLPVPVNCSVSGAEAGQLVKARFSRGLDLVETLSCSDGNKLSILLNAAQTSIAVTLKSDSVHARYRVIVNLTVKPLGESGVPTGMVIAATGKDHVVKTLSGGTAQFELQLRKGHNIVHLGYAGDGTHAASVNVIDLMLNDHDYDGRYPTPVSWFERREQRDLPWNRRGDGSFKSAVQRTTANPACANAGVSDDDVNQAAHLVQVQSVNNLPNFDGPYLQNPAVDSFRSGNSVVNSLNQPSAGVGTSNYLNVGISAGWGCDSGTNFINCTQTAVAPGGGSITWEDNGNLIGTVGFTGTSSTEFDDGPSNCTSDGLECIGGDCADGFPNCDPMEEFTEIEEDWYTLQYAFQSPGTHTVTAVFNPPSGWNSGSNTMSVVVIGKSSPSLSVSCSPNPSTVGVQINCTSSLSGGSSPTGTETWTINGSAVTSSGVNGSANVSLGASTYTINATYSGDTNNNSASASTTVTVNKLTPTVSVSCTPNPITYGPQTSICTATVSSAVLTATGTVSFQDNGNTWSSPTLNNGQASAGGFNFDTAGNHTVNVIYNGDSNHNAASGFTVLTINKSTPTITWPTPAAITYGAPLSTAQLNATASVPGTLTYSPSLGTLLNAGTHTLSVSFVPSDTTDYNSTSATLTLTVNKATPTITWPAPAAITYGTALSGTQLTATASVPGTFTYSPSLGTVLNAGIQTLSASFIPSDTTDYNNTSASVVLTVNKATPTITWPTPAAITYGAPLTNAQLNATTSVPGTFTYSPSLGTVLNAGIQTLSASFIPSDTTDYNNTSASVVLTVNKAVTNLTMNATPTTVPVGTPVAINVHADCDSSCGNIQLSSPAQTFSLSSLDASGNYNTSEMLSAGSYNLTATLIPDANHTASSTSVAIQIYIPKSLLSLSANPTSAEFDNDIALTAVVSTSGLNSSSPVTFYNAVTSLGTGAVTLISTTNLIPYSGLIGQTGWTGYCSTDGISPNTTDVTAPDGSATATRFTMPASMASCGSQALGAYTNAVGGLQVGQNYVLSVWARGAAGGEVVLIGPNDDAAGGETLTTSWQRYSFPFTATAAIVAGGDGFQLKGVIGNSVFYAWGAQLEQVSDPSVTVAGPYIATGNTSRAANGLLATLTTTALPIGSNSITAQFSADSNIGTGISNAVVVNITKQSPTITWATPPAITYGTALNDTQLNATADVPGSFVYSPTAGTVLPAGSHTLTAVFTPSDTTDYSVQTATVTQIVNRATPTITWATPPAIIYGTALSSAQLNATASVPGSFSYSPAGGTVLSAGTQTISVTFTPTDTTNYTTATATVSMTVNQATPTITWMTPAAITYGTALSGTQLNATASVPGAFTYLPATGTVLGAGSQTLSVFFVPTDTTNYTNASATVLLTVNKATPSITWATPAAITYGVALGSAQLNATASVPGTLTFMPASGTVLDAGVHTLSVSFVPVDAANYTNASATAPLTVNKATPTITWATPAAITYGTAVGGAQINATASVPGSFTYSPASGTVLSAGTQTLSVTFTPTNSTDYAVQTTSVALTVNKATPTITWPTPAAIAYGTALGAAQLNASANVAGSFTYAPGAGAVLESGGRMLSATFTPSDTANYNAASASVPLTVNKAAPSISWATPAPITYGAVLGIAQLNATASVPGSFTYSPASGMVLSAGAHTLSVTFTPANSADYAAQTASVTLTVNKATPTITWTAPAAITYGTPLNGTQLDATADVPGTFTYTPASGVVLEGGEQTLAASFTPSDTANFNANSASVPLTVNRVRGAVNVAVTSTLNPAVFGNGLTFNIAVTSTVGTTPTGSVAVKDGAQQLGVVVLDVTGKASLQVPYLAAGTHNIVATYSGDKNFQ